MHYCSIGVVQFALLQNNVNFSTVVAKNQTRIFTQ